MSTSVRGRKVRQRNFDAATKISRAAFTGALSAAIAILGLIPGVLDHSDLAKLCALAVQNAVMTGAGFAFLGGAMWVFARSEDDLLIGEAHPILDWCGVIANGLGAAMGALMVAVGISRLVDLVNKLPTLFL